MSTLETTNFNDALPAAPSGKTNCKWQADPESDDPRNVSLYMPVLVGDSGSGGVSGAVPAPGSGDAAALKFLKADGAFNPLPLVIGFIITTGATGANVGPEIPAPRAGQINKVKFVTKVSNPSTDLTFKVNQNGTDIFSADPTIPHGQAAGTLTTITALTSTPLNVAADDKFTVDITSGTSVWQGTIQLET